MRGVVLGAARRATAALAACAPARRVVRRALEGSGLEAVVRREADAGRTWLDLGCGEGSLAPLFDPARYLGVDLDPGHVAYARRHHPRHRFLCADVLDLPPELGRWSGLLACQLLHHLADADVRRLGRGLRRLGTPDAVFLGVDPLPARDGGLVHRVVGPLETGRFQRRPLDVARLLGLEVVRSGPVGSFWWDGGWLRAQLPAVSEG